MLPLLLLLTAALPLAAQQCTFTLNPTARSVPATPDAIGSINILASASTCARTAVSDSPNWLTISFGTTGTGNGSVGYRAEANTTASIRTGSITVGNARFTLTQAAADCTLDLSPLTARVTRMAGRGTIRVITRCAWTATTAASWLVLNSASDSGDGTIEYSYSENTSTSLRTGVINVGSRTFTLTQEGLPCTVTLAPSSTDVLDAGGDGVFNVASTCSWQATPSQTWITLTGAANGTGNAPVSYRVAANTSPLARTGAITVSNQTFIIRQAATSLPIIDGVTNAASFARDKASPGSVIAVFGARLGPTALTTAELTSDGQFLTALLAGTRVLIDGVPCPMIYTLDSVVSAVVPYNTEGKRTAKVIVEYQGHRSSEYTLPLANTAPGIFTANASGTGPGAILNEDLTLNTSSNAAPRGSTIVIYATGEGVTDPPGVDGKLNGPIPPQSLAPVIVSVGGARAEVTYKGGVSGVTPGLFQINAIVPPAAPIGAAIPLSVNIGGVPAQDAVTVAIR